MKQKYTYSESKWVRYLKKNKIKYGVLYKRTSIYIRKVINYYEEFDYLFRKIIIML